MSKRPIGAFAAERQMSGHHISRTIILNRIGDEFQQAMQWSKNRSIEGAAYYQGALARAVGVRQ